MKELVMNKVVALLMMVLGLVSIIPEHDITVCVLVSMFAVPLFFAKENWIDI